MIRTETPRLRWNVMTLLALFLGLTLGALALHAEPEDDAGEPPAQSEIPFREDVRRIEEAGRGTVLRRILPTTKGEILVIELDGRGSATCLAQPGSGPDPCRVGEAISRMPACRVPEDCLAYETWTRLHGEPGPRPARSDPPAPPTDGAEERE